jgi:CRP-like cAMP-binding protein
MQVQLPDARTWADMLGCGAVTAAECTGLNAVARVRLAPAGTLLHVHGTDARGLVALQEGDVALGIQAPDTDFRTERHLHGPCWLDLSAAWLSEPHAHDARALTAVKLLELPRDAVFEVADMHPTLWRRLGDVLAREVRGLAMNTHDLMHKDAPARLAAWLVQHCQSQVDGLDQGVVQLSMRKRDIASQLAITPETLSRLMRSFSGQGVIRVNGYTVHVLDRLLLQRLAQGRVGVAAHQ